MTKEGCGDEGRGPPPVLGRRAWFSRRAHTEQQQQGICGSSPSSSHARRLSAACCLQSISNVFAVFDGFGVSGNKRKCLLVHAD